MSQAFQILTEYCHQGLRRFWINFHALVSNDTSVISLMILRIVAS